MSKIFTIGIAIVGVAMLSACTSLPNPSPQPSSSSSASRSSSSQQRACTAEAMQCSDGSYVGRTGPNCEFTACPVSSRPLKENGTLQGTMTIGPICPVERVDHPCLPTPEMYAAHQVFVYSANRTKLIATLTPDARGKFSALLPVGIYYINVAHQAVGAVRGVPAMVTVHFKAIVTLTIDIDTGIR